MEKIINFDGVSHTYPDGAKPAIEDLTFDVRRGELLLLVGSSGCGKTTVCRCMNGLVPHFTGGIFSGRVTVDGMDTLEHPTSMISRKAGVLFQDPESQFIMNSVENEVVFGMENLKFRKEAMRENLESVTESLGIGHLRRRAVNTLSGGEKQKVILASLLSMRPKVLVLDEPTSQLDPKSAADLLSYIMRIREEYNLTIVLAEHRLERVIEHADRILDLDRKAIGTLNEMIPELKYRPPATELISRLTRGTKTSVSLEGARSLLGKMRLKFDPVARGSTKKGSSVIEVDGLSYSYNGVEALSDVNLRVSEGEFVAVMGYNGSGKTTLAKNLMGLLKPLKGSVIVCGKDTLKYDIDVIARHIGFVTQNPNDYLFSDTVLEELKFTLRNFNLDYDPEEILERVGISHLSGHYPRDLSGGERQRVALASVLVAKPDVILLDEPTRGVDHASKMGLMELLKNLRDEGHTVIVLTHDVETIAGYADRVIILEGGSVAADGPPHEVLTSSRDFRTQVSELFPGKGLLTVEDAMSSIRQ
ncbi:MAG: energy-coupling factor transporter ATPase [Candidatus Altiarchaeota archaeon]